MMKPAGEMKSLREGFEFSGRRVRHRRIRAHFARRLGLRAVRELRGSFDLFTAHPDGPLDE